VRTPWWARAVFVPATLPTACGLDVRRRPRGHDDVERASAIGATRQYCPGEAKRRVRRTLSIRSVERTAEATQAAAAAFCVGARRA
jgi:hypothetical protein